MNGKNGTRVNPCSDLDSHGVGFYSDGAVGRRA